ncbi:SDR family NAD(P)-dependent oxidoreductase [Lacticaseibacillus saniviri]|uniref:Acetoin dehydrogenase n=1 Tax=Lacticaseibacillus saniviri JCM 17471 = DSM 24301 TaxID=1293598 RepID=A0A0R2MXQ2_9LACO|nr:SDR family NAD(P)-dependent oxidoreductase [Lacticaseibacillus saniviri]KRO16387.1 acetoin dehydrogenase [Lacticaseibacillus saniviri JCM 17471 = DSM 24301]MCG4281055.1 SDR family NAD(P)-dependent oxidoreductase [Lacticaseibacillus saniviri]
MKQPVAIVTGGAQGIGAAIVQRLAQDGFAVGILDINQDAAQQLADQLARQDYRAIAEATDAAKQTSVVKAVNSVVRELGDLDVFINNVGLGIAAPVDAITQKEFDQIYRVNVASVIWGTQAAHQHFKRLKHGGKIINAVAQDAVLDNPDFALYSGAKAAIRGITRVTAQELVDEHITVNAYDPGFVATDLMKGIAQQVADRTGNDLAWAQDQLISQTKDRQPSKLDSVVDGVSFLAGPRSGYLTGQIMSVGNGMQFE